jgi:hypothetical protein
MMFRCDPSGGGDDTDALRLIDARTRVFAVLVSELSLAEALIVVDEVRGQLQAERSRREEARLQ